MKRYVIAAITCIALTAGVTPATASGGLGGVVKTLTGTSQQNTNTAGDASASNANATSQSNEQSQTGSGGDATTGDASTGGAGCCGSGDATSGDADGGDVTQSQEASNTSSTTQEASAESKAVQVLPVNVAVPICVAKACDTGSVEQSNTNTSGDASAKNVNVTDQSNEQWQTGTGGDARSGDATAAGSGHATTGDAAGGDVTQSQTASNENVTSQKAEAVSEAIQVVPVNVAVPVCVAAHCKTGDVEQSNGNRSGDASAFNGNGTWQSNEQGQSGSGGDASTGDATAGGTGCCSSGDATSGDAYGGDVDQSQSASNSNTTSQDASATSKAVQIAPVNVAAPVCIAWHCKTGDVEQSNTNSSDDAWAGNLNHTGQSNRQSQTGAGGDAATGDATAAGGCCKPHQPKPRHEPCEKGKPKHEPQHGWDKGKPKHQPGQPCHKGKPAHEPEHGADAESGEAEGGDVDQSQSASNDNRTGQTAHAASTAKQEGALNLLLAPRKPKPAPPACRPC